MSTLRKLRKLVLHPKEFAADAVKARKPTTPRAPPEEVRLSLIVMVEKEGSKVDANDPAEFLSNVMRCAPDRSTDLDVLLLIDEDHALLPTLEELINETYHQVNVVRYCGSAGFASAYASALDLAQGQWIGHCGLSSRFGASHFAKLQRLIRQKHHGACAFACDLQVRGAKALRINPDQKFPVSHVLGSSAQLPILDLQNLYLSKQVLGLAGQVLSRAGWRDGIGLLLAYFDSVGEGVVICGDATKSVAAGAPAQAELFGLYPLESAPRTGWECQEILALLPRDRELPKWLQQRVAVACVRIYLRETTAAAPDGMPDPLAPQLAAGLDALLSKVDYEVLEELRMESLVLGLRTGILHRHFHVLPLSVPVHIDGFDARQSLLKVKWVSADKVVPRFQRNNAHIEPVFEKCIEYRALGQPLYQEQLAWLPAAGLAALQIEMHGRESPVYSKGSRLKAVDGACLRSLKPTVNMNDVRDLRVHLLRRLAQSKWARQRFRQAWLFLDKDDKADDNAEHFYRAVKDHPIHGGRAYFVLRRESPDWSRLEAEGFRLLPFGSVQHKLALLNCAWLFSSHAAPFVVNLMPRKQFGDMLTYKFCFLQHGVTKDDQSSWLNSRQIDLLVTAGRPEYESMVGGRYKYTAREVALTGFPRYDALQQKRKEEPKKVVIMPTWRLQLAGELIGKTSQRALNPDFDQSQFFKAWNAVLSNAPIHEALREKGYQVVFIPHPNIKPYLASFQISANIEVTDLETQSIQDHLADCALLLTDYSSIAFDVAYLRRPVAYFQFDRKEFFASHTYSKGYFDYDAHGFGPVLETLPELESMLLTACAQGFPLQETHRRRIDAFFAFGDTLNSDRLIEAVRQRSAPQHRRPLSAVAEQHAAAMRGLDRPAAQNPSSSQSRKLASKTIDKAQQPATLEVEER